MAATQPAVDAEAPVQPLDGGLFASLDPPRLLASRCRHCGTVVFPVAGSCPRCASVETEPTALPDRGTVWTWTVQSFAPRAPYVPTSGGFAPFAVGYVDLGAVLVESLLLGDPAVLRIGLPVRLTLTPVGAQPAAGRPAVVTFAFQPDPDGSPA